MVDVEQTGDPILPVDCVFEGEAEFPKSYYDTESGARLMRKWIVFRAEKRQPGWEDRKYAHTGSLTKTLFEHYDCSDKALPEPGYRPPEFIRVDQFADPSCPESKTHFRQSDWEVTRVEAYTPEIPVGMGFDMIVICYCQYSPVNAPLKPMPERQVSVNSFNGDEAAYGRWLESQKQPAEVT